MPKACIPPIPETNSTKCGLVQSTVKVTAKQVVEPSEEDLYDDVVQTLRQRINSGNLAQYFPADCKLQA